jgi:NAD(P)H-dependent FMN reductase
MPKLGVVVASTREGRAGLPVAEWFVTRAREHAGFDVGLIDLKEIDLPLLAEPHHPRLQKYTTDKTRAWAEIVAGHDAFVFVTPEYNHGAPPALINAFDHVYVEWNYKAAAFVSYGGVSGGLRSVQMAKPILAAMKVVPIVDAVTIPFVHQLIDAATGTFKASDSHDKAAAAVLTELARWTAALATLRA